MTTSDGPDQLGAIIESGALAPLPDTHLLPALIADASEQASWRCVECFAAKIRNPHTWRAHARASVRFFAWCEDRGPPPIAIRPFDFATCMEALRQTYSAPGVKQRLASVWIPFEWLVTGQFVPPNPASAVRGPKHVVKTGKAPMLDGAEWRELLDRDRARSARLRADCHPRLFPRSDRGGIEDEGRGSPAARRGGRSGYTRTAASITPRLAIMRSPRRYTPTSLRPALPKAARAVWSAPPEGRSPRHYPTSP